MQIILDDGTQRDLTEYELVALTEAQEEHNKQQELDGIFVQYSNEEATSKLFQAIVNQVEIPIADAVKMRDFYPEWSGDGAEYTEGFKVRYFDKLWRCLQAHESQEDWSPGNAPSLWAKILIEDVTGDDLPEWEQPDSTNPYNTGDRVTHNGKTWVSTIPNNIWEPGAYGWEEVV